MTLGEMKTYVASLVDDPQMTYFTTAQLTLFLNHAQEETQKLLIQSGQNYFFKTVNFSTVANGASYALPSDHLKTNRLEYVQGTAPNDFVNALNSITLNQKDAFSLYAQYSVAFYFYSRNAMILVPIPQQVNSMVHTYTYRLADMTLDADISEIPLEFHKYMCFVGAKQCFLKDQRDISSLKEYTDKVEMDLKREAVERAQDRASTMVITEDFGGWGGGVY